MLRDTLYLANASIAAMEWIFHDALHQIAFGDLQAAVQESALCFSQQNLSQLKADFAGWSHGGAFRLRMKELAVPAWH